MQKKHYIGVFIAVVLAVFLSILGMAFVASRATKEEPKEAIQTVVMPTRYDIVLECQKMASTTQNEGWNYTTCLKELEEALNPTKAKIELN